MAGNNADRVLALIKYCCALLICCSTVTSLPPRKGKKGYEPTLDLIPGKETIQGNLISYFMYNITNPDEFEKGEKPILHQVGPYTYKEIRRKFDVEKVSDSVMQYNLDRYWVFAPEHSGQNQESDEFNIINIPMLILANQLSAKRLPKAFNDILVEELVEKGESLVRRNEKIGDVIYNGMNVSIYTEILNDVLHGSVPPEFDNGIFALLKGKNGSAEGSFTVATQGKSMGDILSFNNKTKLEYWGADFCNKIDGTDGYFFRPGVNDKSKLKIFYPELCRSVYLKWKEEKVMDGVKVGKWTFPEEMLEDHKLKPENACFCSKPIKPTNDTKADCLKKGFVDYGSCKQDSPLLVSYPHFLYADDEYREKVIGMKPNPEKHESEFLIEPKTGTILAGMRNFQFNIKLRPLDNVELFRNTSFMILPIFVTERRMIVSEDRIQKLKQDLLALENPADTKELSQPPPVQEKKADKIIEKDHKPQNDTDTNGFLSDEPQSSNNEGAEAEPEPEPESSANENENEIGITSETKYSKSQSVTKNGGATIFTNDIILSMSAIISLSTLCLNFYA